MLQPAETAAVQVRRCRHATPAALPSLCPIDGGRHRTLGTRRNTVGRSVFPRRPSLTLPVFTASSAGANAFCGTSFGTRSILAPALSWPKGAASVVIGCPGETHARDLHTPRCPAGRGTQCHECTFTAPPPARTGTAKKTGYIESTVSDRHRAAAASFSLLGSSLATFRGM